MPKESPGQSDDPEMDEFKASLGPAGEIMTPQMLEHALLIASAKTRKKIASAKKPSDLVPTAEVEFDQKDDGQE